MEKQLLLFAVLIVIICGCVYWFKPAKAVQAEVQTHLQEVGAGDFGTVYIDTDTVDAVKKDNVFYLIVSVEEVYTDEAFLQQLHQSEDTKDAVSAMDLYMFTSDGRYYCMPQRYLVDKDGKICADLGSDMQMKPIDEKIISAIYVKALKFLENKQRFQSMIVK